MYAAIDTYPNKTDFEGQENDGLHRHVGALLCHDTWGATADLMQPFQHNATHSPV